MPCRRVWDSGLTCAFLASLIFSISALCVKLTGGRIPVLEVCFVRSSLSFLLTVVLMKSTGISPVFGQRSNLRLLFMRGCCGACSMVCTVVPTCLCQCHGLRTATKDLFDNRMRHFRCAAALFNSTAVCACAVSSPLRMEIWHRSFLVFRVWLQTSYYVGLFLLPLGDAVTIGLIGPAVTAIAARLFLKEPLG